MTIDIINQNYYICTKCIKRFDVTDKSESNITNTESGLNFNLDHQKFYTQIHNSDVELSLDGDK